MVVKAVTSKPKNGVTELSLSENNLLVQYKNVIREQDRKIQDLTKTIDNLQEERNTLQVWMYTFRHR